MERMGKDRRFYTGLLHAFNLTVESHIAELRICGLSLPWYREQDQSGEKQAWQKDL
jgi:hypothetical protein